MELEVSTGKLKGVTTEERNEGQKGTLQRVARKLGKVNPEINDEN